MKLIKNFFVAVAMVIGLSVAAMAQKDDPKKPPPPKDRPPVINPGGDKRPKENPPKGSGPRKPSMAFTAWTREDVSKDA